MLHAAGLVVHTEVVSADSAEFDTVGEQSRPQNQRNRAARRISSLSCCFCFPFHCPFTSFDFLGSGHCQVIHIMFLGLPPGVCLAPSSSVSVALPIEDILFVRPVQKVNAR